MINPSQDLARDYSKRADAYSRFWAPVIYPMAEPLLRAMPLVGAERIFDVGTGTGALWPLVHSLSPAARIFGVDRAEGMMREGGEYLRGSVSVMDAENLGIRSAVFDAALGDSSVMRQSWMNTPEKLGDLLTSAGYASQQLWTRRFVYGWTVDKLLATQTECGLPSRRLNSLTAEARYVCEKSVRARMQKLSADELEYRVEVIYAIADRP